MVEFMNVLAVFMGTALVGITSYYRGKAVGISETNFYYTQQEMKKQWTDAFLYQEEEDEEDEEEDE